MTFNPDDIGQTENRLARLLLMLLLQRQCTPGKLQDYGLDYIETINCRHDNVSLIDGIRQIREQIAGLVDPANPAAIVERQAIDRACDAFRIRDEDVRRAYENTALTKIGALITRCQFAVGHGGFHASRIRVLSDLTGVATRDTLLQPVGMSALLDLAYVYDCGSEHPEAFGKSLNVYRETIAERLEILFVSHLHADHINGLDRLLANRVPDIVVLPYLDVEDIAAIALSDFDSGRFSGSLRAYVRDPVSWWTSRGVRTVIFIEPDEGGGTPVDLPPPTRPIRGSADSDGSAFLYPEARLVAALQKPTGDVPTGLQGADGQAIGVSSLPAGGLFAGSGSHFRLEWRYDGQDEWRQADWYLVPYVHPVRESVRAEFRAEIEQHLSLQGATPDQFRARVLSELMYAKKAKALIDIYGNHFSPRDHNSVSMSLYSGPLLSRRGAEEAEGWISEWQFSPHAEGAVENGWLSTGDSMLKQSKRRKPWRRFYSPLGQPIAALTLPHHGSNHNFHDEILAWENLRLALVTTVPPEERVAQIERTLESVDAQKKLGLVIDNHETSAVSCTSSRLFTAPGIGA